MLGTLRYVAKDGYVLATKTIRAAHGTQQKQRQQHAFEQTAPSGEMSLLAATVAAVEGSHWGTPCRRTGCCAGQLLTFVITQTRRQSFEFSEKKGRPLGRVAVVST